MGADTPAEGGENKSNVKVDGNNAQVNAGRNNIRRNNPIKKEKFLGAHPSLQGHVFEAERVRSEQIENFQKVNEIIKAKIGADYDPLVPESLEKEATTLPTEPTPVTKKAADGTESMDDIESMKFKSKYGKYLTRAEIIEKELKQAYSIYFGQISDEMKASLKEDPDFERAFQEKDALALRK